MKPPTLKCAKCNEFVFTFKRRGEVICQQCRISANAGRKYQRLTSKCNWRSGIAPMLPALDRKRKAAPKAQEIK